MRPRSRSFRRRNASGSSTHWLGHPGCTPPTGGSARYVNHLLRVAIRVVSHYRVHDADVVCAARLHDAVEDHAGDLAADRGHVAALAVLATEFGSRVGMSTSSTASTPWPAWK